MTRAVGFALLACVLTGLASGQTTPAGQADSSGVYRMGSGVTDPRLMSQVNPPYTPAAWHAGIEGMVEMEAVVMPDGSVGSPRITRSLDAVHGLDAQALAAALRWRFRPGELNGKPVPVLVTLTIDFLLAR